MENGERIEMKIDHLTEQVSGVRESQATLLERSVQLEKRFEGFANTRDATCPLRPALQRIGDKADTSIKDIGVLELAAEKTDTCVDGLKTKVTFAKWVWRGIVGLVVLAGGVVGLLMAAGAI